MRLDEITKRVSYMGRRGPKTESWSPPNAKSSGWCEGPNRRDSKWPVRSEKSVCDVLEGTSSLKEGVVSCQVVQIGQEIGAQSIDLVIIVAIGDFDKCQSDKGGENLEYIWERMGYPHNKKKCWTKSGFLQSIKEKRSQGEPPQKLEKKVQKIQICSPKGEAARANYQDWSELLGAECGLAWEFKTPRSYSMWSPTLVGFISRSFPTFSM